MTEKTKNVSENLILTMWLEQTAATKEMARSCRESIRTVSALLPKTQVDECKQEVKRRMATGQSPIIVLSDGSGGTVRMDVHAARSMVLRAASGGPIQYDLVLGHAAFCVLSVVHDPLTSKAAQLYYGAIRGKAGADVLAGPLGRKYRERHKAAEALNDRERDKVRDQIYGEMCPVLEAATRQVDVDVQSEYAMRCARAIGLLSNGRARSHARN